ncbi:NAD-dependent epimerase/dehydratase [groundwater metagenome]
MKALVTGGAGFLGSHLCDLLLAKEYEVLCVDNLITGSAQNIAHIKTDRFSYIRHDVTKPLFLEEKIDFIFHLASPASPIDYLELPIQTLKVGALGTHNMLGIAKEKGARFLLASTSEVYGDPLVNPQPEEYWGNVNPIGPRGVTMRRSDMLRQLLWHINAITWLIQGSCVFLTLTGLDYALTMDEWCQTLSGRHCAVRTSPFMGMVRRPGVSAM